MIYKIKNDTYINPKTGILSNLFNIEDQSTLDQVEAELTVAQITTIMDLFNYYR